MPEEVQQVEVVGVAVVVVARVAELEMHQIVKGLGPTVSVEAAATRWLGQVGRHSTVLVLVQVETFIAERARALALLEVFARRFTIVKTVIF